MKKKKELSILNNKININIFQLFDFVLNNQDLYYEALEKENRILKFIFLNLQLEHLSLYLNDTFIPDLTLNKSQLLPSQFLKKLLEKD